MRCWHSRRASRRRRIGSAGLGSRISHGTDDAVLPIDRCARPIARSLRESGYELCYDEFPGPHVVRPESVDAALGWWLA